MSLPVIAGLGMNLLDMGSQMMTNQQSRMFSEKMYWLQRMHALKDWTMQNQYNSPEEQMKRLKMAGLNPNLLYGTGSVATGQSGNVRQSSVEAWNPQPPQLGNIGQSIGSFVDVEMKKAQIDNLKAQNTAIIQEGILKAAQVVATTTGTEKTRADIGKVDVDTRQSELNYGINSELRQNSLDVSREQLRQLQIGNQYTLDKNEREIAMNAVSIDKAAEEILQIRRQGALTQDQRREIDARIESLRRDPTIKDLDIQLKKLGIQPTDALWQRVLGRIINGTESKIQNMRRYFNPSPFNQKK